MNKKVLSIVMMACTALLSANADEYYLIKDGKLHEGVEIMQYDSTKENTIQSETTAPDGTPAYSYKEQTRYKDIRFYIPEGINLNKYWNVEIEFYFKDGDLDIIGHRGTNDGNKWSVINMGYISDTTDGKNKIESAFCTSNFDVKIKNKADVWNVENQMIYAPVTESAFKCFVLGWQRQILNQDSIGPVYIKNIKFYGDGNRPFFAEDFNTQAAFNDYFSGFQTYAVNSSYFSDAIAYDTYYSSNTNILKNQHCCLPLYSYCETGSKKSQSEVGLRRLYENEGTDGSGYYDPELLHAINLPKVSGRIGRNGRSYFLIPTAGIQDASGFTLDYLCKWDGSTYADEPFTSTTSIDSLGMKMYYAFVDDAVEAGTCEMTPAFNDGDLLSNLWTAYHVDIPNTIGAKKYIALIFDKPNFFSYCVDNIRLTANNMSFENATVEADPVGVTAYALKTGINDIIADAFATVSPVPATDVVTVSNEGVNKVEVINMSGAVVAGANSNQVNVSSLAKGVYMIKAFTANGILTAKIIKK